MSKLQGSTLIEVLVSLAILGIVFAVGTNLILGLTSISSPPERFKTEVLIRNYLEEELDSRFSFEEEKEVKGRRLVRTIRMINEAQGLIEIEVKAFYLDREVGQRKMLKFLPSK